jgi:hypothetical protein
MPGHKGIESKRHASLKPGMSEVVVSGHLT